MVALSLKTVADIVVGILPFLSVYVLWLAYFRGVEDTICAPSHTTVVNNATGHEVHFHAGLGNVSLFNVHTFPAIAAATAAQILNKTLAYVAAQESGGKPGWNLKGHHAYYPTTDVSVADVPELEDMVVDLLEKTVIPKLRDSFGRWLKDDDIFLVDAFVVKYETPSSSNNFTTQYFLPLHRDGGMFSSNIALNAGSAYEGGGTVFPHLGCESDHSGSVGSVSHCPPTVVKLDRPGTAALHCGKLLHGGYEVVAGTRYILALFLGLRDSDNEGVAAGIVPRGISSVEERLWREAVEQFSPVSSTDAFTYGDAAAMDSVRANALAQFSQLYLRRRTSEDDNAALDVVRRGMESFPDDDALLSVHAKVLARVGAPTEARRAFHIAIARNPQNAALHAGSDLAP